MPIKHVGYKWQQWVVKQTGKVRERVHPSRRRKPEPRIHNHLSWNELSDEQRAQVVEDQRLRQLVRDEERLRAANQEREHKRALQLEESVLRAKRRALAEDERRLKREEEHLASRVRKEIEDQQWDWEKEMEDYVMRGITPGGKS